MLIEVKSWYVYHSDCERKLIGEQYPFGWSNQEGLSGFTNEMVYELRLLKNQYLYIFFKFKLQKKKMMNFVFH